MMQSSNSLCKSDLFRSGILHVILLIIVVSGGYVQNRKVFLDVQLVSSASNTSSNNITPIKAGLIDQKEVQQAVKRQERLFSEKIVREKQLVQQEQKIAKLAAQSEQEAKKNKAAQDALKKERDLFKKEQENLQKTANKLKQQQQELLSQQAKLDQLRQQALKLRQQNDNIDHKKKKINNNLDNNTGDSLEIMQNTIQGYYNKMYTKIINNRKVTTLFPENLECVVTVKLLSNGQLATVKLDRSSGNAAYDAFSEQAIYKSAPFDIPQDPQLNREFVNNEHVFTFIAEH